MISMNSCTKEFIYSELEWSRLYGDVFYRHCVSQMGRRGVYWLLPIFMPLDSVKLRFNRGLELAIEGMGDD